MNSDYGDSVNGTSTAVKNWLACCFCYKRRTKHKDPPAQVEIQERLMFLVDALKGHENKTNTDLTLCMPVDNYGLLDFAKFAELEKIGYDHAKPLVKQWLEGDSDSAKVL